MNENEVVAPVMHRDLHIQADPERGFYKVKAAYTPFARVYPYSKHASGVTTTFVCCHELVEITFTKTLDPTCGRRGTGVEVVFKPIRRDR